MKIKLHIALNDDICINTQLEKTLTNYIKSDIKTQRLMLLPVDSDKIGSLFTKRLHMMV